jgi:integrase
MATVSEYESAAGKRYEVRYRTPDNRTTRKRGFKRKRDAELWAANQSVSASRGEHVDVSAGKATVGALGPKWLSGRAHLKPSSASAYASAWKVNVEPKWSGWQVSAIKPSDIQAWVSELSAKRSATTVRRAHDVLAGILDSAVQDRRIATNPARGVKLPRKTPKARHYLTDEQVDALANAVAEGVNKRPGYAAENARIVRVLAYTGIRWGELAGLEVSDVDLAKRRLRIERTASIVSGYVQVGTPKTHERRSVSFPAFLVDELRAQIEKHPSGILFPDIEGGHRRTPMVNARGWFTNAAERAGLPEGLTIHDLRHTYASLAIHAGANVKAVQRQLGHASASQTLDTYSGLFEDDLDAVSAALDTLRK